jgi:hypothetical protein
MDDDIIGGRAAGPRGERATGTPNTIYDLSSVLFHALEGGASYDTYIEDAEREGDLELVEFFWQVRDEDSNRADRAQQLLAERTRSTAERIERTTGAVSGTEGGPPESAERVGPLGRVDPLGREDRLPSAERAALGREDRLPREERGALGREDRLPREERGALGREDRLPREERGALGREDRLPREERGALGREDRLPKEESEEGRREEERRER